MGLSDSPWIPTCLLLNGTSAAHVARAGSGIKPGSCIVITWNPKRQALIPHRWAFCLTSRSPKSHLSIFIIGYITRVFSKIHVRCLSCIIKLMGCEENALAASVGWLDMMWSVKDFIVFLSSLRHLCENNIYCSIDLSISGKTNPGKNNIGEPIIFQIDRDIDCSVSYIR